MAGQNRITRTIKRGAIFEDAKNVVSAAVSYVQGDLCYFDTSNKLVKKITADADCATFLGISDITVVSGKLPQAYTTNVDASVAISSLPGPIFGVVAEMKLKTGDAFTPGCLVYGTAVDAQTISSAGTKAIGVYQGITVASAASGDVGEVELGHRYPGDTLVM